MEREKCSIGKRRMNRDGAGTPIEKLQISMIIKEYTQQLHRFLQGISAAVARCMVHRLLHKRQIWAEADKQELCRPKMLVQRLPCSNASFRKPKRSLAPNKGNDSRVTIQEEMPHMAWPPRARSREGKKRMKMMDWHAT